MSQTYIPRKKSGAWSILLALTKAQDNNTYSMTKEELINAAQPFCGSNMRPTSYQDYFTAWNGNITLLKHKLITLVQRKYQLTKSGYNLGKILIKEESKEHNTNIGGYITKITNGFDKIYDLTKPITINDNQYTLCLNIDSREQVHSQSNQIDIFKVLEADTKISVIKRKLFCSDFIWTLENSNKPLLLPFLLERKTCIDLISSIKDGRYQKQKDRMNFAAHKLLNHCRKMYLIEGTLPNWAKNKYTSGICKQIPADLSVDGYCVVATNDKIQTLCWLVDFTFMVRAWIDGEYTNNIHSINFSFQPESLSSLEIFENNLLSQENKISSSKLWMKWLLNIEDVDECIAYSICKQYPTFQHLNKAWNECITGNHNNSSDWICNGCTRPNDKDFKYCPYCGKSYISQIISNKTAKDIEVEKMLLHETVPVSSYEYFEYKMRDDTGQHVDEDLMNCLSLLQSAETNNREMISEKLSCLIWKMFRDTKANVVFKN
eukprot:324763_1